MNADGGDFLLLFLFGGNRLSVHICDSEAAVSLGFVFQLHDAPDSAAEKPVVFFRILIRDRHIGKAKVRELRKKTIPFDVQTDCHHINNGMAPVLAQLRKNFLRLIRADKIVCQNTFHILNALLNDGLIVRTAILPQQELQHIDRNICSFFDFLCQVFPDDATVKVAAQLPAQFFTHIFCRHIQPFHTECLPPLYQNPNPKSSAKAMSIITGCLHCSRPLCSSYTTR